MITILCKGLKTFNLKSLLLNQQGTILPEGCWYRKRVIEGKKERERVKEREIERERKSERKRERKDKKSKQVKMCPKVKCLIKKIGFNLSLSLSFIF